MRPCLIVLILAASTVLARYHEKTRFDRSVHEESAVTDSEEKQWSFIDDVTQFVAYKSRRENDCYLENIKQTRNASRKKWQPKTLYASTTLTKFEAWRLAGGRIVDFCNGRSIILLQANRPVPEQTLDSFLNEIPTDENDIFPRRVADVVLTPLRARTKRHIQLEQREKLNANFNHVRLRRQASQFRGKFHGQTQSQYLNLGNTEQKDSKAEAEATQQSSHAIVSGNRGIGQAQSMSSGSTGCEDCPGYPGYPGIEKAPDKIRIPSTDGIQGPGVAIGTAPGGIPGRQIIYPGGVTPDRVGTYPGVLPGVATGIYPGGIQPGIVTPGADRKYPTDIQPGTISPDISPVRPGIVIPGADKTYPRPISPGAIRPVVPGGDVTYPGGVQPGTVRPGGDVTYPAGVQPGAVRPGGDVTYPGGIQPGAVRPGGDVTYPAGVQPGAVRPGGDVTYPGGVQPGAVRPGGDGTYPAGVQPGVIRPGGEAIYPSGTLITGDRRVYPGGVQPGEVLRAGVPVGVGTGIGTYPGGIQAGVQPGKVAYPPSGVVTTSVTTSAATYPGGVAPTSLPAGTYPGRVPGTYPGTGAYPDGVRPDVTTYPGGIIPGGTIDGQVVYPSAGQTGVLYPGGLAPGTLPARGQIPGTTTGSVAGVDAQAAIYPAGRPTDGGQVPYPSGTVQPGRIPEGTGGVPGTRIVYPGGTYPTGRGTIPVTTYPEGGTQQVISPSGTLYSAKTYPSTDQVQVYPGVSTGIPGGTSILGGTGVPGGVQYPIDTMGGRVGGQTIETGIAGRYPDQYPGISGVSTGQYPGRTYPGIGGIVGTEVPQYYTQPGIPRVSTGVVDDGADSQASSSVQQVDSGTQASATAQGKYGSGTAQSQVTGTYSGTGSFSAQAGTSDVNKSAQTEISGGEQGASSNAQGIAGHGKSQAQVQLDSDSGATSTGAQSSGWNHGTNSQVQASSKGGMADAQANGEGSTSSQAQIGFQPYLKNEAEEAERRATPFRGSGTASAQSGTHRGQSQSQLQGSFQYGITYTGAAQAGSGSGAAFSRKPFNFTEHGELFKPFKPQPLLKKLVTAEKSDAQSIPTARSSHESKRGLQSSSTSKQIVIVNSKDDSADNTNRKSTIAKSQKDDTIYDDEYEDEYTDEDDYSVAAPSDSRLSPQKKFSEVLPSPSPTFNQAIGKTLPTLQQSHSQLQTIQIAKRNDQYDVHINQDSNVPQTGDTLQPGQSVGDYIIPPGFRGRVISTAGVDTIAQGDGRSQSQTVSLVPKDLSNTRTPVIETRSLQTSHERYIGRHASNNNTQRSSINQNASLDKYVKPSPTVVTKPNYYTVTNSFAGKMNGSNHSRKYEHRYYTKSSTCGYFTFSCNVVYGSNGRTKICKPRMPTYSNGTPMRC